TRERLLWRHGVLIPLTAKPFDILAMLIEHRGRIVDKDELLRQIWADTAVCDSTVARHISTLRKALDERPGEHAFIVTLPGHGYEFVADVIELDERPAGLRDVMDATATVGALDAPADVGPARRPSASVGAAAGWVAAGVIVAVGGAAAVLVAFNNVRRPTDPVGLRTLRQFTFHGGWQREPTWSPDGQGVAYVSDAAGHSDIWVQAVTEPNPVRLTSWSAENSQPDWAPDGQSLVFRSEQDGGGLYVVDARG